MTHRLSIPFNVLWALTWAVAALLIGYFLITVARVPNPADPWDDWIETLSVLGAIGIPAGLLQALLVRQWAASPWKWFAATAIGSLLGFILGVTATLILDQFLHGIEDALSLTPVPIYALVSVIACGGLGGLFIGVAQSLVADSKLFRTRQWLALNVGAGILFIAVLLLAYALPTRQVLLLPGLILGAAFYGAITGSALERIARATENQFSS